MSDEAVIQNLIDAGCGGDTAVTIFDDIRAGRISECLKLLSEHRRSLLDKLHKAQKQIDCLDYLVYQLEKKNNINQ